MGLNMNVKQRFIALAAIGLLSNIVIGAIAWSESAENTVTVATMVAALLLLAITYFALIGVLNPLVKLQKALTRVRDDKNYSLRLDGFIGEFKGVGDLYNQIMQSLEAKAEQEKLVATENLRVRVALDNVTTNVRIADNDRKIIYMNKSVAEMMQQAEADPAIQRHHGHPVS